MMVDSDLNGENPQFILTCISTGGPATTVTWTRDSKEVQGGVTVLDNAETAQYTHTLTVTGRLPGQYTCTVSNNKPSTNARSRLVQGDLIIYTINFEVIILLLYMNPALELWLVLSYCNMARWIVGVIHNILLYIRESVDSLCRDGADTPIVRVH